MDATADAIAAAKNRSHAVVSLIDTGINPYHITFRDNSTEAYLYPGTYISDYPADAIALNITLDKEDYWEAVQADCENVWGNVTPGKLYWFPGTKIIGAVYLEGGKGSTGCDNEQPVVRGILDRNGHGTMVASRAASVEYGACKECKIVAIQFPASAGFQKGQDGDVNEWAAKNAPWIDAQSNSWGPVAPIPFPDAVPQQYFGASPTLARVIEKTARAHLAFWASGNGVLFRAGVLGHPTLLAPHMTPSAIIVGGHDSGYINTWPGFTPNVISDSCSSWAAVPTDVHESRDDVGGGTSGATPFAAGGAAQILLEARRILGDREVGVADGVVASGTAPVDLKSGPLADGKLTLEEWKELVYKTATPRPVRQHEDGAVCGAIAGPYASTPIAWKDVPGAVPEYVLIGYGAVDNQSMQLALKVLRGAPLPDRSATDTFFEAHNEVRAAFYEAYSKSP